MLVAFEPRLSYSFFPVTRVAGRDRGPNRLTDWTDSKKLVTGMWKPSPWLEVLKPQQDGTLQAAACRMWSEGVGRSLIDEQTILTIKWGVQGDWPVSVACPSWLTSVSFRTLEWKCRVQAEGVWLGYNCRHLCQLVIQHSFRILLFNILSVFCYSTFFLYFVKACADCTEI
jgi:hypothetical protein